MRFDPALNKWEENFNHLHDINPDLAFLYAFWCPGPDTSNRSNWMKERINAVTGVPVGNSLINLYANQGHESQMYINAGMPTGWFAPDVVWERDGSVTVNTLEGKALQQPMIVQLKVPEDFGYPKGWS